VYNRTDVNKKRTMLTCLVCTSPAAQVEKRSTFQNVRVCECARDVTYLLTRLLIRANAGAQGICCSSIRASGFTARKSPPLPIPHPAPQLVGGIKGPCPCLCQWLATFTLDKMPSLVLLLMRLVGWEAGGRVAQDAGGMLI